MLTYFAVQLSDDLVISTILDICLALLADGHVLGWWSVTMSECWVVYSGVCKKTVEDLSVSNDLVEIGRKSM
jgi:hypothetical protein